MQIKLPPPPPRCTLITERVTGDGDGPEMLMRFNASMTRMDNDVNAVSTVHSPLVLAEGQTTWKNLVHLVQKVIKVTKVTRKITKVTKVTRKGQLPTSFPHQSFLHHWSDYYFISSINAPPCFSSQQHVFRFNFLFISFILPCWSQGSWDSGRSVTRIKMNNWSWIWLSFTQHPYAVSIHKYKGPYCCLEEEQNVTMKEIQAKKMYVKTWFLYAS